jgi:hypothetical protein
MPNGKLSDKYKGKPFGQIAKEIQSKYQDRFDPISKRGLMSEMSALKDQQEFQKAKMEAQQMLQQAMSAPQQMQGQMQQPQGQMQAPMMASNQGVAPQMPVEQPMGHSASQSYNEQFGYGGTMDYSDGGFTDPTNPFKQTNFFDRVGNITDPIKKNIERGMFRGMYPEISYMAMGEKLPINFEDNITQRDDFKNAFDRSLETSRFNQMVDNKWNLDGALKGLPRQTTIQDSLANAIINSRNKNTSNSPQVNKTENITDSKKWDGFNLIATDSNPGEVSRINPDVVNIPERGNPFQATTDAAINKLKDRADSRLNYMFNQRNRPEGFTPEVSNPLRYAPLAANLFGILSARKAPSTQSEMARMGYRTSVDENLGSQVSPRQTLFSNVDVSQLERGITNQARGFTSSNLNVSGGNAGMFLANELGNQGNIMNAIGNARMQAQQQDRQTQAMNAQEQARIDQFLQGQAGMRQQAQAQNIGIGMQMTDLDARNLGAFNTNRAAQIAGLATNLGNIGKESDQMKMVANALGYNSFGEYVQSLPPDQRGNAMQGFMQMIGNMFNRG